MLSFILRELYVSIIFIINYNKLLKMSIKTCKTDSDCPTTTPAGCCLYTKYVTEGAGSDEEKA